VNIQDIIENRFITPLLNKKTGNVGVELEFPMLNMDQKPVDEKIANGLLKYFLKHGFEVLEKTIDGKPAFIGNEFGDAISFDNSYNNVEFAMNYGDDLCAIADRFYKYFETAQKYLSRHNYFITGMGINPYKEFITQSHVNYSTYNMVDSYLRKYSGVKTHRYPDFPAYLSSVQTHLDITPKDLPRAVTLLAKLDFVRALLFSNSPSFDGTNTICFRDYLWEHSGFGLCAKNTGKVDEEYKTLADIANSFLDRSIFNIIRDGEYKIFEPVSLSEYFTNEKYGAIEEDIETFLSFRNVEITKRGTLEVRSDCTQPLNSAFAPPAFSLGIVHNLEKAEEVIKRFIRETWIKSKNSTLRDKVIYDKEIKGVDLATLSMLLLELVDVAADGLRKRGRMEQKFLTPLYERADTLICPAKRTAIRLKNGELLESIIYDYGQI